MYIECAHNVSKWHAPASRPVYRKKREKEIAVLERMHAYVIERKPAVRNPEQERVSALFDSLAIQWRAETAHLSSIAQKVSHPAYMRIIGLGPLALPFVLRRLDNEPGYWFAALRSLTGHNPARPEDAGNFRAIRDAWLGWGRSTGII